MIRSYLQILRLFSRNTRLFLLVNSLTSISYAGIYVMLFNLYLLRLSYGPEFIGLVNAIAQLGVAIFSIPAGMMGRRWGSRRLIIIGLTVATIGLGLVPLVEFLPVSWQTNWLVATYIFAWLGGGTYLVNSLPFLMGATDSLERAHVFSVREALVPLLLFAGNLVGGLLPGFWLTYLGGTLADPMPYRYTLFIAAALFGLAPITMLATSEVAVAGQPPQQPDTLSAGTTPAARSAAPLGLMLFMGTVILLILAGKNIIDTFFNVYLDVSLHLPPVWIGTLSAIAQLLIVPIALIAPLVITKWGKSWTIMGGALGMAFSLGLLIVVPDWIGAGLGLMGVSALFAITNPAFTICNQEAVAPEWRAAMSGVIAMATGLSRSGMAFGGGSLITAFGFSTSFLVAAGLTVAAAVLFWGYTWLPRRYLLHRQTYLASSGR